MANKSLKVFNYLGISIFLTIICLVAFTIFYQKKLQQMTSEVPLTTTTTQKTISPKIYQFSLNAIVELLSKEKISIPENLDPNELVNNLLKKPEIQKKLIEALEPVFIRITTDQPKDERNPVRQIAAVFKFSKQGTGYLLIEPLDNPKYLRKGDLAVFFISTNDILKEKNISFNSDDIFYFCGITQPSLMLPGAELFYKDFGTTFFYDEGLVSCSQGLKMNTQHFSWAVGILEEPSYNLKLYLVDAETQNKIKKVSSLGKAEEILNQYPLIYEKKVNIIPN